MPASRRGEGLGYFGVANNLAMAVGPMTSLFMHTKYSYDTIFYTAILAGLVGFTFASLIKAKNMSDRTVKQPMAFDRFFLFKGFMLFVIKVLLLKSFVSPLDTLQEWM